MHNQLSKTCAVCGLQKPISAFLQITGPEGTSYGNVCSTCRGSSAGKKIVIPAPEEEHSSSSSGLKIDGKAKVQIDRDKKKKLEEKVVLERDEELKKDEIKTDRIERQIDRENQEKDHRENYIKVIKPKTSFLDYQSKKPPTAAQPRELDIKDLAAASTAEIVTHTNEEKQNLTQAEKAENIAKGYDTTNAFQDTQTGEIKYQSAEFLKAKAWLGNSAAFNTYQRQFLEKKVSFVDNTKQTEQREAKKPHPEKEPDKLSDFAHEKWEPTSPGSGRRR